MSPRRRMTLTSQFSRSSVRSPKTVHRLRGASHLEGALKVLMLAVRIAISWTLLSLLLTAVWVLFLAVGRQFGSKPASKPSGREERQVAADVTAIYADRGDSARASGEARVHCERDEASGTDAIILIVGTASARER
jgi:hypothetical protein